MSHTRSLFLCRYSSANAILRATLHCIVLTNLAAVAITPAHAVIVSGTYEASLTAPTARFEELLSFVTVNDGFLSEGFAGPEESPRPQPYATILADNPTISGSFSYDNSASPIGASSSTFAQYVGTAFSASIALPTQPDFILHDNANIQISLAGSLNYLFFHSLVGNNSVLKINNPTPSDFVYDLLDSTSFASGATGLPPLSAIPVRLTEPSIIEATQLSLFLYDAKDGTIANTQLPTHLTLVDFSSDATLGMYFDYDVTFTVNAADYASDADFQLAQNYVTNNLLTVSVSKSISAPLIQFRVAPAEPGSTEAIPILPDNEESPFFFDVEVAGPQTVLWYDPPMAIGYEYEVLEGANFNSVQMPSLATVPQTGDYELQLFNGTDYSPAALLAPGESHMFATGGVSKFRIMGIDPSLALDPNNDLAFPTGLSFVSSGQVRFSMTPILAVPEPRAWMLLLIGLALALPHSRRGLRRFVQSTRRSSYANEARPGGPC